MSTNSFDNPSGSESERETASRIVGAILDGIQPAHEISPSGELYRVIGRYHRVPRIALYGPDIFSLSISENMASDQDINRRQTEENEQDSSPLFALPLTEESADLPATSRGSSALLSRGQSRSVRPYLNRLFHRNRSALRENVRDSYSELQHASQQLDQASSNLRALIHEPISSTSATPSETQPVDTDFRRIKRRKLDSDNLDTPFIGFSYGKYGQAEPGKLKMEIVSCDGGIFEGTDMRHTAENVLENDNTVYCTKSNRCNLILRHQGATVFCLKELCIKAPHTGYTAPVQEGMVFISMTSDNLLARTAQYQIQYTPLRSPQDSRNNGPQRVMSTRHGGDVFMTTAQNRARRLFDIGRQDEECDHRTAQIPQDFIPENAPPFSVTTECSDSDGEESSSRPVYQRLSRLGIRFAFSDDSDSYEEDGPSHPWRENFAQRTYRISQRRRSRQPEASRNTLPSNTTHSPFMPSQDFGKNVEGGLMAPHARFFIERDKSKCTVKFDPPVSGRFILLKMWSPHHDASENIDIQSVVAIGFAGPRYFPAIKPI